jgi:protein subunit release factor B
MSDTITIRIHAGRGPHEARRFVAMLCEALCERVAALDGAVLAVEHHGDDAAPQLVMVRLCGRAAQRLVSWFGPHLLCASLRGRRARRRWFAVVELEPPDHGTANELVLAPGEIDERFVRSRGPGGQNVNKRETAVQLTHRPSSITVFCDTHRSQARNRALARVSLARALVRHRTASARARRGDHDALHLPLTTRAPVMCWRLDPGRPETIIATRTR